MPRYAADTSVSSDQSRAEIERTLRRYGADQFVYGWQMDKAMVGFSMEGRQIRFILPMPDREDFRYTRERQLERRPDQIEKEWEQATRQRWRALALVIKAKLEAVESGITIFEDEFMAHIVLPNGSTVGEFMRPQIEEAYVSKKMPSMLALGPGK